MPSRVRAAVGGVTSGQAWSFWERVSGCPLLQKPPLGERGVLQPLRTDTWGGEGSPASAHSSPDARCSPTPLPARPDAAVPTLSAARHIAKPLTHFFSVATLCVRPLKRPRITVGVSSKRPLCPQVRLLVSQHHPAERPPYPGIPYPSLQSTDLVPSFSGRVWRDIEGHGWHPRLAGFVVPKTEPRKSPAPFCLKNLRVLVTDPGPRGIWRQTFLDVWGLRVCLGATAFPGLCTLRFR